jgi:16S rRNA (guanine527-N7)-methyltransferase
MLRIIAARRSRSTTVDMPADHIPPQVDALREQLTARQIAAADDQIEQLDLYRRLLWSWNERMNLTRHTTMEKFVERDMVDSYELSKLLEQGERVLDVGTGSGVPGIPIAILRPDLVVNLCDSTQKKARAVEAIVADLALPIRVYPNRAEDVLEITTFDTLVARALAPMAKVLGWLQPHWGAFDQLLLIKGRSWVDERAQARQLGVMRGLELRKATTYETPGSGAESVILSVRQGTDRD